MTQNPEAMKEKLDKFNLHGMTPKTKMNKIKTKKSLHAKSSKTW